MSRSGSQSFSPVAGSMSANRGRSWSDAGAVAEQDQAVVGDPVEVLPVVAVQVLVGVRRQHPVVRALHRRRGVGQAERRARPAAGRRGREVGVGRIRSADARTRSTTSRGRGERPHRRAPRAGARRTAAPATDEATRGRGGRAGARRRSSRISSLEVVHHGRLLLRPPTSSSRDASSNMDRSEASAREVWLLTVPSLQPRAAAVSRDVEVLEVAQHHARPLPPRQLGERRHQRGPVGDGRGDVLAGGTVGVRLGRALGARARAGRGPGTR